MWLCTLSRCSVSSSGSPVHLQVFCVFCGFPYTSAGVLYPLQVSTDLYRFPISLYRCPVSSA